MNAPTPLKTDYLGPMSIVVLDDVPYTVKRPTSSGWELVKDGTKSIRNLTREELARGESDQSIKIIRPKSGDPSLAGMPLDERRTITIKHAWMRRLASDLRNQLVDSTGDVALKAFHDRHYDDVEAEIRAWEKASSYDHSLAKQSKPRKRTVGSRSVASEYSISTRQMKRLLKKFIDGGGHPLAMRKDTEHMGRTGSRLSPAIEALVVEVTKAHAREDNQSIAGLASLIAARMVDENIPGEAPSPPTVKDRIKNIPEAKRLLARKGAARTKKLFGPFGEGPEYYRVGERVEADCWNIPLMVLLEKAGVLNEVPSEIVTDLMIVAQRIHVAVLVEVATGYVLGMTFGLSESGNLVTSALRMALTDKSGYVAWAGCNADWKGCTGIEGVANDAGPAYYSSQYQAAVYSACDFVQYAASGLPHLRGLIESLFSTLHKGFIARFIARTFENVVVKGDYDPASRAVLTAEAFLRLMVLYVVDVYHNQPRDGGLRQSPREEYMKLARGSKRAPNNDELRAHFGVNTKAKLGAHGLRFMHIEYDNDWLLQYRLWRGLDEVEFLVDEQNLGAISVLLDGDYITVPAKDTEFEGVPLQEWLDLLADLRRRFSEQAEIDFRKYVAPALIDIERTNRTAEAALFANDGVGPAPRKITVQQHFWSDERFRQLAENLQVRVVYDRPAESGKAAPSIGSGTIGRRFKASAESSQSNPAIPTDADPASDSAVPSDASAATAAADDFANIRPLKLRKD